MPGMTLFKSLKYIVCFTIYKNATSDKNKPHKQWEPQKFDLLKSEVKLRF